MPPSLTPLSVSFLPPELPSRRGSVPSSGGGRPAASRRRAARLLLLPHQLPVVLTLRPSHVVRYFPASSQVCSRPAPAVLFSSSPAGCPPARPLLMLSSLAHLLFLFLLSSSRCLLLLNLLLHQPI